MHRHSLVFLPSILILSALACNVAGTEIPDPHAIATSAAATLTTTAGGPAGGGSEKTPEPALTALPDSTAEPTAEPTTEPTLTPTVPPPHLRMVYVLEGNIYIKDGASAPVQITFSGDAEDIRISDDGQKIAYTRRTAGDEPVSLGAVNSDGTGDLILVTGAQVNALYPLDGALYNDIYNMKFIPGTHRLLFNTRQAFEGPGLLVNDDVLMADLDTAAFSTVLAPPDGGDFYPSPDGTRMAISRAESISLADIDGGGYAANILTFPLVITYSEYAFYPPVVWKQDSSMAGVIIPSPAQLEPDPTGTMYRIDRATMTASAVTTLPGQFMFPRAVFSPDLVRIGYAVPTSPSDKALYVQNIDDASSLHLADGVNVGVTGFSPSGAYFIYYYSDPRTYYVGSLGGGTAPIGPTVMDPIWINGTQFVYLARASGTWSINLGNTGGASSVLASGAGEVWAFDADE